MIYSTHMKQEKQNAFVHVRVPQSLKDLFVEVLSMRGKSISQWVRDKMWEEIKQSA